MNTHRVGSLVLLAAGVLLVFAGLSAALRWSTTGVIASAVAIAALLYAGAVWFGAARRADASVLVFTPQLIVAVGPLSGRPILDLFPATARSEIGARCRAAIDGRSDRFRAAGQTFDAAPVRGVDGAVIYGILIAGAIMAEPAPAG